MKNGEKREIYLQIRHKIKKKYVPPLVHKSRLIESKWQEEMIKHKLIKRTRIKMLRGGRIMNLTFRTHCK